MIREGWHGRYQSIGLKLLYISADLIFLNDHGNLNFNNDFEQLTTLREAYLNQGASSGVGVKFAQSFSQWKATADT
jgi:hypothetical protein